MKKSTLITTIAMIVVVVVALSTATYAWFTAGTQVTMTQEITTTGATGWLLYGGTETSNSVNFSSTLAPSLVLQNGLNSPTAAITTALGSKANTSVAVSNKASFYTADFLTADTASSSVKAAVSTPGYIRVINGTGSLATLQLLIYVVVTDNTNDGAFYAADAFQTYVTWNDGSSHTANTIYTHGVQDNSTIGDGAGYYLDHNPTAATAGSVAISLLEDTNGDARSIDNATVTTGYRTGSEITVADDVTIASTNYFYALGITCSELANGAAANFAIYTWLDGWMVDNSAAHSSFKLIYQFGDNLFHIDNGDMVLGPAAH